MLVPYAHFFVYERGVTAVDDVFENLVGFVQNHHVLLLEEIVKSCKELSHYAQTVGLFFQDFCREGDLFVFGLAGIIADLAYEREIVF